MKRFHVNVTVDDLEQSVRFYSTLFAAEPTVLKVDYAKWMLEDPRVNFAISVRGDAPGINHLGLRLFHPFQAFRPIGVRRLEHAPAVGPL